MKKVAHVAQLIQIDSEQLASSLSNLGQDNPKISDIKTQIAKIVTKIDNLKASLQIFIAAKDAIKKIDSGKNDPFTRKDITDEIKLINRQIHYYGHLKLINEVKIEVLSTKKKYLEPEAFENCLLELRLQEKETRPVIQNLELAIDTLKKVSDEFSKNPSASAWDDYKRKECINEKIQLLEKAKSKNNSLLENIKEKIKILKEPKFNQDTFLLAKQDKPQFFNGNPEKNNSIPELRNSVDQESYLNQV